MAVEGNARKSPLGLTANLADHLGKGLTWLENGPGVYAIPGGGYVKWSGTATTTNIRAAQ